MTCDWSNYPVRTTATVVGGKPISGYTNVYETGVEGIGVQFFGVAYGVSNTQEAPFSESKVSVGPGLEQFFNAAAKLIVTGPVKGGRIDALPTLRVEYKQGSYEAQVYTVTTKAPIIIGSKGCRITTPMIDVPMPRGIITSREVPGSLFGAKSFNIGLADCSAEVKVYASLTDASNPMNMSETLSLSRDSTAKGVGFRITHEGKVIKFAPDSSAPGTLNQFLVTTNPAASFFIPMEVSYIRTNEAIQPGTAIGNVTLNMSYQ